MMWARHKTLIAVAAAVLLAGLVAGSFFALRHGGQATGAEAPSPSPPAAAIHPPDRPDRGPVRGHHQRVLPGPEPGRPLQPVRAHGAAAGAGAGREHGT